MQALGWSLALGGLAGLGYAAYGIAYVMTARADYRRRVALVRIERRVGSASR